MKRFIFKYWYLTLVLMLSMLCYASVFIPPTLFWPSVFASYAIPGVLVLNILLPIVLPFFKRNLIIFPIIALISGIPFAFVTISYKGNKASDSHELSILSYNAKLFRKAKMYDEFSGELIKWVAEDISDIKCIQEYSTNAQWEPLDVTKKNLDQGYWGFTHNAKMEADHNPGLAIFSKFPILYSGIVWQSQGSINDGIFADIKYKNDTIRIYNVHLASMHLRLYQYKNADNYLGKIKRLISMLKYGAEARSSQIDKLIAHTNSCPYPYVVCGDFNETPYSYNYFRLRGNFQNAFEEAGNGFGFTLNSVLFFLRIDHQFYSEEFEAIEYRIDRSMKISDHFPTRGYYQLKKD